MLEKFITIRSEVAKMYLNSARQFLRTIFLRSIPWILTILVSGLLSGCYISEAPIVAVGQGVTPLPASFSTKDESFTLDGSSYKGSKGLVYDFFDIGFDHFFGVQVQANLTQPFYLLTYVAPDLSKVVYFDMTNPASAEELRQAGIAFAVKPDQKPEAPVFQFSDLGDLRAAMRLAEAKFQAANWPGAVTVPISTTKPADAEVVPSGTPVAPAPDTVAPNACDQLAANPNDPRRKAAGVLLKDLDGYGALSACASAVMANPDVARFYYQRGRANVVLGEYAAAKADYETAIKLGDPIALLSLGTLYEDGHGVPLDVAMARNLYRQAQKAGIDVSSVLIDTFSSSGFSRPQLFDAIFNGQTQGATIAGLGDYLFTFVTTFTNQQNYESCRSVVNGAVIVRLEAVGAKDDVGKLFQSLTPPAGNLDNVFGQGFRSGADAMGGLAAAESDAEADAALFYERYGCSSQTADKFFANLSNFAMQN
ncbi:MAG: hypothetical protein ACOH2H_19620 [Cypionkella sp.]